jgi:hypothetical protein
MKDLERVYTYSDYLNFPGDERWEIIDGVPYMMSAPLWEHLKDKNDSRRKFWIFFIFIVH